MPPTNQAARKGEFSKSLALSWTLFCLFPLSRQAKKTHPALKAPPHPCLFVVVMALALGCLDIAAIIHDAVNKTVSVVNAAAPKPG